MLTVRGLLTAMFTPVAKRLAGIDPNALTAVSLLAGVLAGVSFVAAAWSSLFYLLAGLLVAASGAADVLDGLVARMYGRVTRTGDFFDHIADRFIEVAVLAGIAWSPHASPTAGAIVIVLTLLHSYLGTQIEATFGAREYAGAGKPEQFFGFMAFAAILTYAPDGALVLGSVQLWLADLFFLLLGVTTAAAMTHRFMRAVQLARSQRESAEPPAHS